MGDRPPPDRARTLTRATPSAAARARVAAGEGSAAPSRRTLAGLTRGSASLTSRFQGAAHRAIAVDAFTGGFASEKAAIVLDIGAAYTKCGFSNESVPRHIVRSVTTLNGEKVKVYDPDEQRPLSTMAEVLVQFLHEVFYTHLLVKTTDRRIVLVEQIAQPVRFRQTIVDLLYRHYLVQSILHVPVATVATVPLWLNTALVVDCGYTETTVTAVFDGVPAINSFYAVPAAAVEVHNQIKAHLTEQWEDPTEEALEDIKVRACIAGKLPAATKVPVLTYPIFGRTESIKLDPKLRLTACDSLFDGVGDGDASSIPSAILDALMACPVDARKRLARNIVLCGGTAMLPGFRHRLAYAIAELAKEPEYRKLVGEPTMRTVVKVTLAAAEIDKSETAKLRGFAHRIVNDLVYELMQNGVQISDAETDIEDGKVVCTITSPDKDVDLELIKKDNVSASVGRMFAIMDRTKSQVEATSGLLDAIAFAESQIPENIVPWVGASVLGALETLATKSIAREAYLKQPSGGPDFTSNCLVQADPTPQKPTQAERPKKWDKNQKERPAAWGPV